MSKMNDKINYMKTALALCEINVRYEDAEIIFKLFDFLSTTNGKGTFRDAYKIKLDTLAKYNPIPFDINNPEQIQDLENEE